METTRFPESRKRRYSGEQTRERWAAFNDKRNTMHGRETAPASGDSRAQQDNGAFTGQKPECRGEDYFRNLYSIEPDFFCLGLKYPEFGASLRDGVNLDFTDPAAVMQLTKTLLLDHFGLRVELPADRLCPPVPSRHNYILWLKDLMDSTSSSYTDEYEPGRRVTGLDIGTGASLIYPLLGCTQRPAWHFIATDIDAQSLTSARMNARQNNLESRIRIVGRTASDRLIPLDELGLGAVDFAMTNPPFYASDTELLDLAARKSQPPHSACTGAPVEMACEGGEVGFVKRMIEESLALRGRVQWYTAMLGKQSSLEVLIEVLRSRRINNFAVTTFIQGSKTRRWALGWSFICRRPSLSASRGCGAFAGKKLLPPTTAITIYQSSSQVHADPIPLLVKALRDTIESLDLPSWSWDAQNLRGVGFAEGNVWSRAYRRRKARGREDTKLEISGPPLDALAHAFGFSLSIQLEDSDRPGDSPAVLIRWLQGDDATLFESFVGVIQRCLRRDPANSG
ncbi:hypothetical protein F5Y10DRAFT_54032 [Nemania abortiva]|nr:hypothetical protein F5Y10DRAFT_54032 [Nemania abortiva]